MSTRRTIVIGAGPAGLVSLKTTLHFAGDGADSPRPFDPICFEASDAIGGTFDQRSYENGALVSSKQLTAFSDYRLPRDSPDHLTLESYVAYLRGYCTRWGLDSAAGGAWEGSPMEGKSRIQLGVRVLHVRREGKGHMVKARGKDGHEFELYTDSLLVCTGLHVLPAVPSIPGLPQNLVPQSPPVLSPSELPQHPPVDDWKKSAQKEGVRVIHSSHYKKREEFKDRRVLILGIGETSMDLSYEAIQGGAKEVVVCHRGGFLSFPKVLNDFKVFGVKFDGDLPIDGLITNLFETAYVHPWVAASHIRWFVSDFGVQRVLRFMTGTSAGCNQWVGSLPPSRLGRAYVFLNKSSKAMPYINKPYKPKNRFLSSVLRTSYIDPPQANTPCDTIDLALWPSEIASDGRVVFSPASSLPQSNGRKRPEEERMKNRVVKPDMVVMCTGYRQDFSWLEEGQYPRGPGDRSVDVREVTSSKDLSVGWIGFVRPGVGAIPPIAEQQVMLWALLQTGQVSVPKSEPHYRLLASETARIQYGVDHSAYMSTLAKDMGAAPSLRQLYSEYGIKVLICYCFGAAFGSFYRLVGPLKGDHEEMKEIIEGELWETITRRGVLGNLFMGVIPMVFYGWLNLLAFSAELMWIMVGRPSLGKQHQMGRKSGGKSVKSE